MKFIRTICFSFFSTFILSHACLSQSLIKVNEGCLVADSSDSQGSIWGDFDNDGNVDLFVPNAYYSSNFLYQNNGDGTFTKRVDDNITTDNTWSRGGSWGDYDNDGFLDLFVANTGISFDLLYRNNGDSTFTEMTCMLNEQVPGNSHSAAWGDYDNDGFLDLFVANYNNAPDYIYRNKNGTSFIKIDSCKLAEERTNSSSPAWADYDNDGDVDLFVANGEGQNNSLYNNNGDGTFTKILRDAVVDDGGDSPGGSWGDYDNDGDFDLFVTNNNEYNCLYQNNGDGTFFKKYNGPVVNDIGTSVCGSWGDFDNDGDLDLFVSNKNNERNFFYLNHGNGEFSEIAEQMDMNDTGDFFGCNWIDYDNDGDLDLFVSANAQNNILYNNTGTDNNWIKIKCVGRITNRAAIGTKIRIKAHIFETNVWQLRQISSQTGRSAQDGLIAHFGLGNASVIDFIRVEWPSGIKQFLTGVDVNQFLTIFEDVDDTTTYVDVRNTVPLDYSLSQNYPNPFNPATTIEFTLPVYSHVCLKVYNISGVEVARLLNSDVSAGHHQIQFVNKDFASGIYVYRLEFGGNVLSKKMILLQ